MRMRTADVNVYTRNMAARTMVSRCERYYNHKTEVCEYAIHQQTVNSSSSLKCNGGSAAHIIVAILVVR